MVTTKTKRGLVSSGLLLAGLLAAGAAAPAAADDMFLKMDGIQGESLDARHKGEMEILSYTQAATGPFARGTAGAGAAGKAVCGTVTIVKYVDLASPDLILNALNGRHIPKAVITFRKPGQQFEYYKVTLDDVIVTEVEQTDGKTQPRATEKVTLMGRRFNYEYTAQTPQGGTGGRPKAGWDCVAASKA
ncbi:MAG TPA: type VI secretion system tube protein Hcp [Burkholderiales bacterium]|nr:type VI secretion system tube protein Hcp [Burkholderiales bacterium]